MLISSEKARVLDVEASAELGLNLFALVEAAGSTCAKAFVKSICAEKGKRFVVLAGSGNNAADALVMLKTLILEEYAKSDDCFVILKRPVEKADGYPLSMALLAIDKLGVKITVWDAEIAKSVLKKADFIIDGITGTGLKDPLKGTSLEMAEITTHTGGEKERPFVVSIDIPSGNFDGWRQGMPVVKADATLAIEPQKLCLYTPAARRYAGNIIQVNGIFPPALMKKHSEAELIDWHLASSRIPRVDNTAHKYDRGLVEIRAGSTGTTGAALLASKGAQAAGAGLVRLIVDPSLYPLVAPACSGVMAVSGEMPGENERFAPSAILLGPGWGKSEDRKKIFDRCLPLEKQGTPLILDADAIPFAKDAVFNGNVIITPHTGEFSALSGIPKEEILSNPVETLKNYAAGKNVHILFKSHVMYVVSPDGRTAIIDGMNPALAAGGTGDILAGFCAAVAARADTARQKPFDGYACACAAASLLINAAKDKSTAGRFIDPSELILPASRIAGSAWLSIQKN